MVMGETEGGGRAGPAATRPTSAGVRVGLSARIGEHRIVVAGGEEQGAIVGAALRLCRACVVAADVVRVAPQERIREHDVANRYVRYHDVELLCVAALGGG